VISGAPVVKTVVVAPACVTVTVEVCAITEPAKSRTAAERAERMVEDIFKAYWIIQASEPTDVKLYRIYRRSALDIPTSFKLFLVSAERNECTVMGQNNPHREAAKNSSVSICLRRKCYGHSWQ
jgi:hypothetical protein